MQIVMKLRAFLRLLAELTDEMEALGIIPYLGEPS